MRNHNHSKWAAIFSVVALMVCLSAHSGQAALKIDFLMDSDPDLLIPETIQEYNPRFKTLWLAALERPETDMQRMAAETIARGHAYGIPGMADAVPRLQQILASEKSHPAARFAAARTLIILDARESAEELFHAAQNYGDDFRHLIEPALANWHIEPIRSVWIARLNEDRPRRRELLLAIDGLAIFQEETVVPKLLSLAREATGDPDVRLAAAAAAGQIQTSGLVAEAVSLADRKSRSNIVDALCAVRLLAHHDADNEAKTELVRLAHHSEPTVVAYAMNRLNEMDSTLLFPLVDDSLQNPDPVVRQEAAQVYLKNPTPDRIRQLSVLLADVHPDVRHRVVNGFWEISSNSNLKETIQAEASKILEGEPWQGQEMAALLLGMLEYQPAAQRLVELLESPRTEVAVTSAWALRKVAVSETVPALIDKARRQTEERLRRDVPRLDEQVAHLFEALGVMNAETAIPILKEYVPKRVIMGPLSRSAAIWSLGRLYEGKRDAELEDMFVDRMCDNEDKPMEVVSVKSLSAVALGRMNATEQHTIMHDLLKGGPMALRLDVSIRWSILKLTGESLPPPKAAYANPGSWFLEPIPKTVTEAESKP